MQPPRSKHLSNRRASARRCGARPSRRGPRRGAPAQGGAHEHGERVVRGPLQQEAQGDEGQPLGRIGQDDELVAGLEPELLAGLRRLHRVPEGDALLGVATIEGTLHEARPAWSHLFSGPGRLKPIVWLGIALAALQFGSAILQISTLGFLGYGAPPPTPEWGLLIAEGRNYVATAWWLTVLPGVVVVLVVLATNRLSQALRGGDVA